MNHRKNDLIKIVNGRKVQPNKLRELEHDGLVHLSDTLPPRLTPNGYAELNK